MLLMLMMAGVMRLLGEPEKDGDLETANVLDLFSSKLLAGHGGVFKLESLGGFLMLSFLSRMLVR